MKSRIDTAEPTAEGSTEQQLADDAAEGVGDTPSSAPIGRRGVLGAVAAGAFLAACGNSAETTSNLLSDGAATSSPSTTGIAGATAATPAGEATSAGGGVPAVTGSEVVLPTPVGATTEVVTVESTTGATAAPTAAPTSGNTTAPTIGSAPASTAAPTTKPVVVVDDPSTPTTQPPATDPSTSQATTPAETTPAETTPAETTPAETTPPQTAAPTPEPTAPVITPVANGALVDLVVSRATYGYTPGMRAEVGGMGAEAFVADQLAKNSPDPAAERLAGAIPGIGDATFKYNGTRKSNADQLRNLAKSNLVRATNSKHQLFEVMSHFWADHFNVEADSTDLGSLNRARHYQELVIRPNAMGKFRDLLHAVIRSPAMLSYLDQADSNANDPEGVNENLGREILELHTLGIDENERQIYSETDVQQASLALAGMTYRGNNRVNGYYEFFFQPKFAYNGEISLLGGQWTNAGRSGQDVADSMITFLANHPQTARYIAYKLCRRFVADFPSASLVESTAAAFQSNDTEIVPTLAHIFRSSEFAQSSYQKYRRPFEFNVAAIRALGSNVVAGTDSEKAVDFITKLGHVPWQHPTPDGYPDIAVEWITSGGMQDRWNLAGNLPRGETAIAVNKNRYVPEVGTVDELVAELGTQFGIGALEASDRAAITTAVGASAADNAGQLNNAQIARMTGLVLSHPLFQTR